MYMQQLEQLQRQAIQNAEIHGRSTRTHKHGSTNAPTCQCCSRPLLPILPLSCPLKAFSYLGVCFPLYFQFMKSCGRMLLFTCLLSAVLTTINLQGSSCEASNEDWVCKLSIANISSGKTDKLVMVEGLVSGLFVIGMMFIVEEIRSRQHVNARFYDSMLPQQSQYAALVRGLPTKQASEIIQSLNLPADQLRYLIPIHSLEAMQRLLEKCHQLEQQMALQTHGARLGIIRDIAQLPQTALQLNACQSAIEKTQAIFNKGNFGLDMPFTGCAVVVLENPEVAHVIRHMKNCQPCEQPSDLIWENIGKQSNSLWVLPFAFTAMAGLMVTLMKVMVRQNLEVMLPSFVRFVLNLLVAGVIAITNSMLGICIRKVTALEQHESHSKYFRIVGNRLTLVFFVNMVLATFLLNSFLYNQSALPHLQLVNDYFFLFLTNSYISSIFNYFDIVYGMKLFKRWRASKAPLKISPKQLNLLYEGHPIDMALRYANVLKTMHFTGFVVPFLPIGPVLAVIGILISYWVDKYLLITRYVCKQRLSYKLARGMSAKLRYFVLSIAVGNFIVHQTVLVHPRTEVAIFHLAVMALAAGYCLLGRRLLLCFLCRKDVKKPYPQYEQAHKQFTSRYVDFHPAVEQAALLDNAMLHSMTERLEERLSR